MTAQQIGMLAETGIPLLFGMIFLLIGMGAQSINPKDWVTKEKDNPQRPFFKWCGIVLIIVSLCRMFIGLTQ